MINFIQDLRYAIRMLINRPGFTLVAVLTLALGIGACTAIFSVVDGILLRPLPYPEPERIVQVREVNKKNIRVPVTEPNFKDIRSASDSLESIAIYRGGLTTVLGGSQPVFARSIIVSNDFFRVLQTEPLLGSNLPADGASNDDLAIVSYGFWQRLLEGKTDLSQMTLNIYNRRFSVIAVMPRGFAYPEGAEVWVTRNFVPPNPHRTAHNWSAIARLRPGVTNEQAQAELTAIGAQLKSQHGESIDAQDFALIPVLEFMTANIEGALMILLGAVGFLLLIACANVANLMLARTTGRQKEIAVRVALGASQWRLLRQFIAESLVVALLAGAIGVLLSIWGVDLLVALNRDGLPRAADIGVDSRVLVFTVALSVVTALILGVFPAFRGSMINLQTALKEAGRDNSGSSISQRIRSLLVVSQFALTLVLLIGAGLLGKSFYRLLQIDPGFDTESAVVMDLAVSASTDDQRQRAAQFYKELLDRIGRLPGVTQVGGINSLPMTRSGSNGQFLIDNNPSTPGEAEYRRGTKGYFEAMGMRLIRGRLFVDTDTANSPPVAVISQSLADKYWPGENPLGRQIQFGNMDGDLRPMEIVGIVSDVREYGLEANSALTIYANSFQRPLPSNFSIVARSSVPPNSLIPAMRSEAQALNSDVPLNFKTLDQVFSSSLDSRRFTLFLCGIFATVALILALTGIYAVMAYSVTERTREIGVRMALGAQPGDVMKMVLRQGLKLAGIGVVIGVAASLWLTKLIATMLYEVTATDPLTFAAITGLLVLVALLACFIPARRATRVDPMVALRYE